MCGVFYTVNAIQNKGVDMFWTIKLSFSMQKKKQKTTQFLAAWYWVQTPQI